MKPFSHILAKIFKYLWIIIKIIFSLIFLSLIVIGFIYLLNLKNHDGYVKTSDSKPVAGLKVYLYCGSSDLWEVMTEETALTDAKGYYRFVLPEDDCKVGSNVRSIADGDNFHTISKNEVSFYQVDFIVKAFDKSDYEKIQKFKDDNTNAIIKENERFVDIDNQFKKDVQKYVLKYLDSNSYYQVKYANLDNDREQEAFVYMTGKGYCEKSYSCNMEVLDKIDGTIRRVHWFDKVSVKSHIYLDKKYPSVSRKYKDIDVYTANLEKNTQSYIYPYDKNIRTTVTNIDGAIKSYANKHNYHKIIFDGKFIKSTKKENEKSRKEILLKKTMKYVENSLSHKSLINNQYTIKLIGKEPHEILFIHLTNPAYNGRKFALIDTRHNGLQHVATHLNQGKNKTYIVKDKDSTYGFSRVVTPIYFEQEKDEIASYQCYYRDDLDKTVYHYPNEKEFKVIAKELENTDNLIVY